LIDARSKKQTFLRTLSPEAMSDAGEKAQIDYCTAKSVARSGTQQENFPLQKFFFFRKIGCSKT